MVSIVLKTTPARAAFAKGLLGMAFVTGKSGPARPALFLMSCPAGKPGRKS